ncbi:hypothetical protein SERLA73DRAFT_80053 [Serpula lacrymans var. lacrymans S7.3]|uniref:F-box domain-containing protein n=2 Tax=Serpula lacrymans var. lacrymans TaxID=341189 RepID=F8QII8_SERL3|nr:uncharacterized protein SERLADRAFT_414387 [Serpula lacrymans var. lacrymans S7.9]EGN91870.1 hypothetical protein SERLA73DRAFT_80053 [Serpula lacrymans var. lacrymans S7.3]EGO26295.1 hypothetical protein SERLADRAFT_414387 [Serpula lacrymans var. lacrymans S7.9]
MAVSSKLARPPGLVTLPTELILNISELALLSDRSALANLALTSRCILAHTNVILYRTVVLATLHAVFLFLRTVMSIDVNAFSVRTVPPGHRRPVIRAPSNITSAFLQTTVKRLAITLTTYLPGRGPLVHQIARIIELCSGVQTIVLPVGLATSICEVGSLPRSLPIASTSPSPTELVISSYADLTQPKDAGSQLPALPQWRPTPPNTPFPSRASSPAPTSSSVVSLPIFTHITRLRICEPSLMWHTPHTLVSLFPNLTHAALARRAHANADNDLCFLSAVRAMLACSRDLRMLVVVVFPFRAKASDENEQYVLGVGVRDSEIWSEIKQIRDEDSRVWVMEGTYGAWAKEWEGNEIIASASGPGDWWQRVMRSGSGRKL